MPSPLCLNHWWLVAEDCRSETCVNCGQLRLIAEGEAGFASDEGEPEPFRPPPDAQPMTDEALIRIPRARR